MSVKRLLIVGAVTAGALAVACQDEDVPTTGSIVLNVQFADEANRPSVQEALALLRNAGKGLGTDGVPGDSGSGTVELQPSIVAVPFTSVRATAEGPSGTRSISLTLVNDFWEGSIGSLQPGDYTVTVQAFEGTNELAESGSRSGVTVVAGGSTPASLTLVSFKPTLNAIASPGTRLTFPVSWSAVTGASAYRVEASLDSNFTGVRTTSVGDSTNAVIAVNNVGAWNVRVRATAAGVTGAPSASRATTVSAEAPGATGDDAAGAPNLGFGAAADGLLTQLNIAPSTDEDWFGLDACQQDSLIVDAVAEGLVPSSPLNTFLRLFAADGTTILDQNDDFGGITDALLELLLPTDGPFFLQVTGVGGTTGAYELDIFHVQGPNNTGTSCALPPLDSLAVNPGAIAFDALTAQQQLTADAYAGNTIIGGVTFIWATDDSSVATVDANGLVTATGNGTANITATSVTPAASRSEGQDRPAREESTPNESERLRERRGKGDRPSESGTSGIAANPMQPPVIGSAVVTVAQAPASLVITPSSVNFTSIGDTLRLNGEVRDRLTVPIAGALVGWGSNDANVATVDSSGLVTSQGNGSTQITAASDTVGGSAGVTVLQAAAGINKISGDAQSAFAGNGLAQPLVVRVVDGAGGGIPGETVNWSVTAGGGAVSSGTSTTDANGLTQVTWTMGGSAGTQTVDASSGAFAVTFTAEALVGIAWANATSGNWNVGANWVGGVVPGPTDNVLIGADGNFTVTLDVSPTVAFLQIGATTATGPQLLQTAGFDLAVTGTLATTDQGVLSVSGGATVSADTMLLGGLGVAGLNGSLNATFISNTSFVDGNNPGISIDVTGEFENAGELKVFNGGFIGFGSGTFTGLPSGLIQVMTDGTLDFTIPGATFAGPFTIDSAGTVNMTGVTGDGTATTIVIAVDGVLDLINTTLNAGSINNAGSLLFNNSVVTSNVANDGYLATFNGTNAINGQVTTTVNSTIEVNGITTTLDIDRGFTNNGNITLTAPAPAGGVVELRIPAGGATLTNTGLIEFTQVAGNLLVDEIVNSGTVTAASTLCCLTLGGNFTNNASGFLSAQGAGALNVSGNLSNVGGEVVVEPGATLSMLSGGATFANVGVLRSAGTIDVTSGAAFVNDGLLAPGGSGGGPGLATVNGNLTFGPNSILEMELDGTTAGVDQDQLVVSGTITLDGQLDAVPGAAFDFTYGNTHQIITFTTSNGGFSDLSSLDFGGTGAFRLWEVFSGVDLALGLSVPQVVVTPPNPSISSLGATVQLAAEAREFDAMPIPSISFTWNAITPTIISVDGTGLVTALGSGASQVDAVAVGGAMGTVTVSVAVAPVGSIAVSPAGGTITTSGGVEQYTAVVRDTFGVIVPVPVTWSVVNPTIGSVDGSGLAMASNPGQTSVQATTGGVSGYATLTASFANPAGPVNLWEQQPSGTAIQLNGVHAFSGGDAWVAMNTADVLQWSVGGWSTVVTGLTFGHLGIWGSSENDLFTADGAGSIGHFDGSTWTSTNLPPSNNFRAIWGTSPDHVVAVGDGGLIAMYDGTVWDTVSSGTTQSLFGVWGYARDRYFAVGNGGTILQYDGTVWSPMVSGTVVSLLGAWGFDSTDVFAVSSAGNLHRFNGMQWNSIPGTMGLNLRGVTGTDGTDVYAPGIGGIIARYDGTSFAYDTIATDNLFDVVSIPDGGVWAVGANGVTMRGFRGATVAVTPSAQALGSVNETVQLSAAATDGGGNPLSNVTFTWSSSVPGIANVDQTGLVTAAAAGTTEIIAEALGGAADTATIVVVLPPASVTVSPSGAALSGLGSTTTLAADVRDVNGDPVVNPTVTWTSLNTDVASVGAGTGLVTLLGAGQSVIQAEAGGIQGYATITGSTPGGAPVNLWATDSTGIEGLNAIWGTSGSNIYAGGNNATMVRFDGAAWNAQAIPIANVVTDIWGTSASDIVATSSGGSVLRWNGSAWGFLPGNTSTTLNGIWAATPTDRWIVGADGEIGYHDGSSWTNGLPSGTMNSLIAVWGTDADTVFVVGAAGTILRATDGLNFSAMSSPSGADLTDIWGTATNDVYAVGGSGTVLRYDGANWTVFATLGGSTLYAIGGTAPDDIYVSTEFDTIYRYNGATWDSTAVTETHFGLWGAPQGPMFAVGRNGTILRGIRGGSVLVTPAADTAFAGGGTVQLSGAAFDDLGNPVSTSITWVSSDLTVATVDASGLVTAVSTGTVTITAAAPGGASGFATIEVEAWQVVDGGAAHTCAVTANGRGFCWGSNSNGELGTGDFVSTNVPTPIAGGLVLQDISAGDFHTCAVTTSNEAYCWGLGQQGQLGNSQFASSNTPVLVNGGSIYSSINAGERHSCAVTTSSDAACWGWNGSGQVGDGTNFNAGAPVAVLVTGGVSIVTVGSQHTCALTFGSGRCWGSNSFGQLGNGTTSPSLTPGFVGGGPFDTWITAGGQHTCAVAAVVNTIQCWGQGTQGQLGDGTFANDSTLVSVQSGNLTAAGDVHSCSLNFAGAASCWGDNSFGQLGDGTFGTTGLPQSVSGGLSFAVLNAGGLHTCGLTSAGELWCWGSGTGGQLGNGTSANSGVPARVSDP